MLQRQKIFWIMLPLLAAGCATRPEITWVDTQDLVYSTDVPEGLSSVVFYRKAEAITTPLSSHSTTAFNHNVCASIITLLAAQRFINLC